MSEPRLQRNTRVDPVDLRFLVARANKERFAALARHAGYSASGFFDVLVENMPLDERGYPTWLPYRPEPDTAELPIESA